MTDTLRNIREGKVEANAQLFLPLFGTNAWGNCASLISQALKFTNVDRTISSMACATNYDDPKWKTDPCCNWELQQKMCCAPRDITFPVPEPEVDASTIAEYCSDSLEELAMAIYASKSYVETLNDSVDATKGCLGQKLKQMTVVDTLKGIGEECKNSVMGKDDNWGQTKAVSTTECTTGEDCYTGECAVAEENAKTRFCTTSQAPEDLITCFYDKLSILPKAKAIFKDMITGGKIDPTDAEVAHDFAGRAGRETCLGQNGWQFNPTWRSCENWDNERGICLSYYCDDREDCKEKCLDAEPACNARYYDRSMNEETCLASGGSMGDKWCGRCWGASESNCHETSLPSKCQYHGFQGSSPTDADCLKVGSNMKSMFADGYGRNMCMADTDTSFDECMGGADVCTNAGFSDVYGCAISLPAGEQYSYCYSLSVEGRNYYPHWNYDEDTRQQSIFCVRSDIGQSRNPGDIKDSCEADGQSSLFVIHNAKNACRHGGNFCYSDTLSEADCNIHDPTTDFGSGYYSHFDSNIGKCKIDNNQNYDAAKHFGFFETCDSLSGWTSFKSKHYEQGQFNTEEKCGAGVCDLGWDGQSEESCLATAECDRWNCKGCTRDWSKSGETDHSVCIYPEATNAASCNAKVSTAAWDLENKMCIVYRNRGEETCTDIPGLVHATCDNMLFDTCSLTEDDGTQGFKLSTQILKCVPTMSGKCNTKEECESAGDCHGGLRNYACVRNEDGQQGECSYRANICVLPKEIHHGYRSCDVYGDWNTGVEHQTGPDCALMNVLTKADCDNYKYCPYKTDSNGNVVYDDLTGQRMRVDDADCITTAGEWKSTQYTEETCLDLQMCKQNQWNNNDFSELECDKCGQDFGPVRQWYGGTWRTGKMRPLYKWMDRKWGAGREWVREVDRWMIDPLLRDVIDTIAEEVESTFVQCMYGGLIDSVDKVSCSCGIDRTACDAERLFGSLVSLVNTTSYKDAEEMAGRELATRIDIADDTMNSTTIVEAGSVTFIPKASNSVGDTSEETLERRRRRLAAGDAPSINDPECTTVVTNSNNASLVGQLVGDCVTLKVSVPLANPARLCLATKDAITRAPEFTTADIAFKSKNDAGDDVYTAQDIFIHQIGSQFCFNVTDSLTACPIMRVDDFESPTEDVRSGECALLDLVMNQIVMEKQCKAGDRKSCKWLEPGSTSFYAAISVVLIVIGAVIGTLVTGAVAHPKSRAIMAKHLNRAFFKEFDKDGDGLLSQDEARVMFKKEFDRDFSKEDMALLYKQHDVNGDGQLSYDEFQKMMKKYKDNKFQVEWSPVHNEKLSPL